MLQAVFGLLVFIMTPLGTYKGGKCTRNMEKDKISARKKGISLKIQGHLYVYSLLKLSTKGGLVLSEPLSGMDWVKHK